MPEIEAFLFDNKIDVLCVNEHWLASDELEFYIPDGCTLAADFCRTSIGHGGVSVYTNKNFCYSFIKLDVSELSSEKIFEVASIAFPALKLIITTVYRTPESNVEMFIDKFYRLLVLLSSQKNLENFKIVITADLNLDVRNTDQRIIDFINILNSHDFMCLNSKPTRLNSCNSKSLL